MRLYRVVAVPVFSLRKDWGKCLGSISKENFLQRCKKNKKVTVRLLYLSFASRKGFIIFNSLSPQYMHPLIAFTKSGYRREEGGLLDKENQISSLCLFA